MPFKCTKWFCVHFRNHYMGLNIGEELFTLSHLESLWPQWYWIRDLLAYTLTYTLTLVSGTVITAVSQDSKNIVFSPLCYLLDSCLLSFWGKAFLTHQVYILSLMPTLSLLQVSLSEDTDDLVHSTWEHD